jgi:hypothetical protein
MNRFVVIGAMGIFALAGSVAYAQTQAPKPDLDARKSIEDRVFRITDPVGCVVWTETMSAGGVKGKAFRNQCTFRVEVAACGVGADRLDCSLPIGILKYQATTLDPHPPHGGGYQSDHRVHSGATLPYPTVTSVVACPVEKFSNAGLSRRIWQLEKTAGMLTGKCIAPYKGTPPAGKIKSVDWPFYAGSGPEGKIAVRVVQE